jgi:hypothetical protein
MGDAAVRPFLISSVALLGLWLGVACAESQTRPRRIGPAVFGGTATRAAKPGGGLDLSAQLFGAYDDDVLADQNGSTSRRPTRAGSADGLFSGLGIALRYARPGDRADFRSWANSAVNYYPDLRDLTTTYHQVGLSFAAPFGRRFSMYASPFATYSPRYAMQLFPVPLPVDPAAEPSVGDSAAAAAPDLDSAIVKRESFRYGGNVGLSLSATNHTSVNVAYGYTKTTSSGVRSADFEVQTAGVSLGHKLTRYASLRVGYSLHEGTYEGSGQPVTRTQNVDVGVDYQKALSLSRRTFLRFNTGSVIASDQAGRRRIQAVGFASLVHQMGRTWTAQAQYRREVRYIEGFVRPVFGDSAGSSVSGLLSRRVDVAVNAAYFTGTEGLTRGSARLDSYWASARLRRALTRTLATYVEYLFYHYGFDEAAVRPAGLPRTFNRNGARVGLSLWLPLTD